MALKLIHIIYAKNVAKLSKIDLKNEHNLFSNAQSYK